MPSMNYVIFVSCLSFAQLQKACEDSEGSKEENKCSQICCNLLGPFLVWNWARMPKITKYWQQVGLCLSIYIYFFFFFNVYAVGGESWPPQGGDLVPSTLPAAEPSILARGICGNLTCANRGVFRSQIPLVRGPNSLPSRLSQKRPSKQSPKKARNHYFYSVFVHLGAFFQECPKNTEKPSCRECYYLMSFSRGLFSYKFPFFFKF